MIEELRGLLTDLRDAILEVPRDVCHMRSKRAYSVRDNLNCIADHLEAAILAQPEAAFTEKHGVDLRGIKVGEVLTAEQWEAVCTFVREQDTIIMDRDEAAGALAGEGDCYTCGNAKHDGRCQDPKWATAAMCDKLLARAMKAEAALSAAPAPSGAIAGEGEVNRRLARDLLASAKDVEQYDMPGAARTMRQAAAALSAAPVAAQGCAEQVHDCNWDSDAYAIGHCNAVAAQQPATQMEKSALIAWTAVAQTLSEVAPGWDIPDGACAMDRACKAIRTLAQQPAVVGDGVRTVVQEMREWVKSAERADAGPYSSAWRTVVMQEFISKLDAALTPAATPVPVGGEVAKLQAFKDYVHQRLDEAGIPTHPEGQHSAAGCRVGDRLDIALAQQGPVVDEAAAAKMKELIALWLKDASDYANREPCPAERRDRQLAQDSKEWRNGAASVSRQHASDLQRALAALSNPPQDGRKGESE